MAGSVGSVWPLTARSASIEWLGQTYLEHAVGGVVLSGPAGVGKTRLGEEMLARAGERPTARAVGHAATQPIPLGALAHLLPAELAADIGADDDQRAALFHRARAAIAARGGDTRLLLLVDDVDQLDDTSLALLLPLTVQRAIFLVATIRTGRALPATIASLAKDGHLVTHEVMPFGHDDVVTLLHRVLDGPVDTASGERLTELSQGNLQVLREIVDIARQRDALRFEAGAWRLIDVPVPRALEELVQSRLAGLSPPERRALDHLAVAGRLTLDELTTLAGAAVVSELLTQQLLKVTDGGSDGVIVSLTHPVHDEVLRAQLGVLDERAIKHALADVLEARGHQSPEALSQLAAWRLDAGDDVAADVLIAAGRLALVGRDATAAKRFAEAAWAGGASHDAARIAIEAAALTSDAAAAERVVTSVWDDLTLPDDHRAHLSRRLATIRFARGDLLGALAITEDAAAQVTDPRARDSVRAQRAQLLATMGRPAEAMRVLDDGDVIDHDPRVRTQVASARSIACTTVGRYAEAIDAARAGAHAQAELPEWLRRRGMAAHLVNEAHALGYSGRFREAQALIEPALAVDAGALAAQVWFHIVLGETWRDRGYGALARDHFRLAVGLAEPAGLQASLVWSWVGVAEGHLLRGEADAAAAALAQADAAGDSPIATSWSTRERTRAWLTALRGDLAHARDMLGRVADTMRADGVLGFEVVLRHDIARFGDPALVVDRLDELASVVEGPWMRVLRDHARGLATSNVALLDAAVAQFETIDSVVFGAEAALELAELHRVRGDGRSAAAAERRAMRMIERSGGARTPGLLRGATVSPLTAREREVALLAATGLSSHDIAGRLALSTRTVDTHLARVYRKLGIGGRDELDDALAQPVPT